MNQAMNGNVPFRAMMIMAGSPKGTVSKMW